jgi:hypothetical protein
MHMKNGRKKKGMGKKSMKRKREYQVVPITQSDSIPVQMPVSVPSTPCKGWGGREGGSVGYGEGRLARRGN